MRVVDRIRSIPCRDGSRSLEISVSRCLQVLDKQLTTDGTYWRFCSFATYIHTYVCSRLLPEAERIHDARVIRL